MKKLLVVFLVLGSISAFATNEESVNSSCETQAYLSKDVKLLKSSIKRGSSFSTLEIGGCLLTSRVGTDVISNVATRLKSNNVTLYNQVGNSENIHQANEEEAIVTLKVTLENCGCTKL